MGWKLKKIELCGESNVCGEGRVKPNEERDIIIELERESRAAIHGVVRFPNGKPVKGAVVKLFKKKRENDPCDTCDLVPITFTFTDECGQFLFGVDSDVDYIIKVFFFKPEKPCPPKHGDKDDDCHHY